MSIIKIPSLSFMGFRNRKKRTGNQKLRLGAHFFIEHWRSDILIGLSDGENICPDEFIEATLFNVFPDGGTPNTLDWYFFLFSDDYTPLADDTYASHGYTEATSYDETTRPVLNRGSISNNAFNNTDNKATFTMTGTDTVIYGAGIATNSTKGDTAASAILGPFAQFIGGAVSNIVNDDVLKVYLTFSGLDGSD